MQPWSLLFCASWMKIQQSSQTISKNVTLSLALKSGRDMAPCIGSRLCRRPSRRQLWGLNFLIMFLRWARFGLKGLNMYYGRETTSRHNGVRHRILSAMAYRPFPFCFPVFLFSHPFHGRFFLYIYCFLSRVLLVFSGHPILPFHSYRPIAGYPFPFPLSCAHACVCHASATSRCRGLGSHCLLCGAFIHTSHLPPAAFARHKVTCCVLLVCLSYFSFCIQSHLFLFSVPCYCKHTKI